MTDCGIASRRVFGHPPMNRWMIALSAVILISGCATRSHIIYDGRAESHDSPAAGQAQTDPHFVYAAKTIEAESDVIDQNRHYEIRRVSFPSIGFEGGRIEKSDLLQARWPLQ